MRCFLGLDLDAKSKLAVEQWRSQALPHFPHPVPVANFHITSVFLGQIDTPQLDQLTNTIDKCSFSPVTLTLDKLGFWSKPKILWLGCEFIPAEVVEIAESLTSIAKQCKIPVQERRYIPHVTLVRKVSKEAPAPLFPPQITCQFNTLHLFESLSGKHGIHYPSRAQWPLFKFRKPDINH